MKKLSFLFALFVFSLATSAQNQPQPQTQQPSQFGPINPQIVMPMLERAQKAQNCNPTTLLRLALSPHSMQDTADRLVKVLNAKNIKIYPGSNYGLNQPTKNFIMPERIMLVFGTPSSNLQANQQTPLMDVQYPLRMIVFQREGKVYVGYMQPSVVANCYPLNKQTSENTAQLDQLMQNIVQEALGPSP